MSRVLQAVAIASDMLGVLNSRWPVIVKVDPDFRIEQVATSVLFSLLGIVYGWGYQHAKRDKAYVRHRAYLYAGISILLFILLFYWYSVLVEVWLVQPMKGLWGTRIMQATLVVGYGLVFALLSTGLSLIAFLP